MRPRTAKSIITAEISCMFIRSSAKVPTSAGPVGYVQQPEPQGVLMEGDVIMNRNPAIDAVFWHRKVGGDRLGHFDRAIRLNSHFHAEGRDPPAPLEGRSSPAGAYTKHRQQERYCYYASLHSHLLALGSLQLDLRQHSLIGVDLEELLAAKPKCGRDEHGRKTGDKDVVVTHDSVVIAAGVLQIVFDVDERLVKVEEVNVGLQVRVVLGQEKDAARSLSQAQLVLAACCDGPDLCLPAWPVGGRPLPSATSRPRAWCTPRRWSLVTGRGPTAA